MMKYGNKKILSKRIINSPVFLFILLIIFAILLKATVSMFLKWSKSGERLDKARQEIAMLEQKELELNTKVQYLRTDEGVQAEARRKYRALREGESVAVIVEEDNTPNASTVSAVTIAEASSSGFLGKILQLFGF